MKIRFKDIEADTFKAKLSEIKEGFGAYGSYLRLIFTIIEGELKHYRFSGIVKPTPIKPTFRMFRAVSLEFISLIYQ